MQPLVLSFQQPLFSSNDASTFSLPSMDRRIVIVASIALCCLTAIYYFRSTLAKLFQWKRAEAPLKVAKNEHKVEKKERDLSKEIDHFLESIISGDSLDSTDPFVACFPKESLSFTSDEARAFVKKANEKLTTKRDVKEFVYTIPDALVTAIYKLGQHERMELRELLRAYLVLRLCAMKKLDAAQTLAKMKRAKIDDDNLRYQFAKQAAKFDSANICDEISSFDLQDRDRIRKIAEIVLYSDAETFFDNLNEFGFTEDDVREEFYLRGLMRSTDIVGKLLEDGNFLDQLRESFPEEWLKVLYQRFQFGKKLVQEFSQEAPPTLNLNEEALFVLLVKKTYGQLHEMGFKKPFLFLDHLDESEKSSLLSLILFLNNHPEAANLINEPLLHSFFDELHSFHDPFVRFAGVILALKFDHLTLAELFKNEKSQPSDYPLIFSLIVNVICKSYCPNRDFHSLIIKKWKDIEFRKKMILFVAELFLAEKLSFRDKEKIAGSFLEQSAWQNTKALTDFSVCLARRLMRPLREGKSPTQILDEEFEELLSDLGAPHQCSLPADLVKNLKYREDISHYANCVARLPQIDKDQMVPRFFKFLRLLAEGKVSDEKYCAADIASLFSTYKMNLEDWKEETRSTVDELIKRHPEVSVVDSEIFEPESALKRVFEESHLDQNEYPDFYEAAFGGKGKSFPLIEKKDYGKKHNQKSDEKIKKELISHRLSLLIKEKTPTEQRRHLQELEKYFSKDHDFGVDVRNWIKAINKKINADNKAFGDYVIVKSDDPYVLFRIGTVAGGSCQRVTGDPAKNKCLLSYPFDGKNQAVLAEKEGDIEARAILRFFYACSGKPKREVHSPILYLEPMYPGSTDKKLRLAMTLSAVETAKKLGVFLVRHKTDEASNGSFKYDLRTINGPMPYEYFDGLPQKVKDNDKPGMQSICYLHQSNIHVIFDPNYPDKIAV